MECEGLLPHLQVPATCSYPQPDQSSPCPPSHSLKINLIISLPSTPGSSKWSLSLKFPHQNPVYTSPLYHTCHMPHPSHSRFDRPHNIWSGVQIINLLHSPVTPSLLGPNIPLNTLFSSPLSLRSSLNFSDQVSHPYKTSLRLQPIQKWVSVR